MKGCFIKMPDYCTKKGYEHEEVDQFYSVPSCNRDFPEDNYPYDSSNNYRLYNEWVFGPFKIEYVLRPNNIGLVFKFNDRPINDTVLTTSEPSFNFNLNIFGVAGIRLLLDADFSKKRLTITGEICLAGLCNSFSNTLIAKW